MSSEKMVLQFAEVGKIYPPQRTPMRQLWSHLRGHQRSEAGGYTALHPVSFEVERGQALGIVGLNGAGKSTLLQLAAGTLTPSHGEVKAQGRIAALLELGSGFNPEATGRENIYLYAATMGLSREQLEGQLDSIIAFSGLNEALDMPVKTYSSGMQVRLAFSVATSVEPDILIVDEALSVGDGVFAKRSFDRVMQLRERGTALLLCSHALFHVDLFCERTLWLNRGKIHDFGATAHVLPRYQEFLDSHHEGSASASSAAANTAAAFTRRADELTPLHAQVSHEVVPQEAAAQQVQPPQLGSDERIEPPLPRERKASVARMLKARVRLDGIEGKDLQGTSLRSQLEVDVDVQVSHEEPSPRAAVVISSDSGKIIASSLCDADAIVAQDKDGKASIRFLLPALQLNKGRYRIGVYLLSQDGHYVYEWTDPFAHIELTHDGIHQGPWLMPGQWLLPAQWRAEGSADPAATELTPT